MTDIKFTVYGIPKAQPRPRSVGFRDKLGNVKSRVYQVENTTGWRHDIIFNAGNYIPDSPIEVPCRVDITFLLKRPQRLYRKKDPDGCVPAPGKPDRDNLDKVVLDALVSCGILRDDALVIDGRILKLYHAKTGKPGAIISISTTLEVDMFWCGD